MADTSLSYTETTAILSLLDDPSPAVRRGLIVHFKTLGDPLRQLLQDTAQGNNRHLAWHARGYLEELNFVDPVAEFREFIRSLNYELETGALMLARTINPQLNVGACIDQIEKIAARCRELIIEPSSTREKCRIINRVLFHECGFHGNTENYTDPQNSFIDRVLKRRRGIPVSLCILYLLVAQRLSVELEPIGLPGHFMIGCFTDQNPFFIDAFDGGLFRSPEEIFVFLRSHDLSVELSDLAPTPVREVLCRNCRNLANHYQAQGNETKSALFDSFVTEFEATHTKNIL